MNSTPIASRLHISIFGRRNVGKSTLINALTNQDIAVVSDVPGTTTDPVYKTMELLPIGPVVITDTAGIDDEGELGNLRIEKTHKVLRKTEFCIIVISAKQGISEYEMNLARYAKEKRIPTVAVVNKTDINYITDQELLRYQSLLGVPCVRISSIRKEGIEDLKQLIIANSNQDKNRTSIVGDLISSGDLVVLVTPIDKSAPKGRLILPQQQIIRDIIDIDAIAIITKEYELKEMFNSIKKAPSLVIADSQAILKVTADTPRKIPLTSFSILFARYKGELLELVKGIRRLRELTPGSKVLIVEGCTHHRQSDDIGSVKIPRWIRQICGSNIHFEWSSGSEFPVEKIGDYQLLVHCGACMLNSQEMKARIELAKQADVPITNYGMLIAYVHGVLSRVLEPFPAAHIMLLESEKHI